MIVIDASVAVKWFLPEEGSEPALKLLEGPQELAAPELIRLEVAAAITRRVRLGQLSANDGQRRCQAWFAQLKEDIIMLIADNEILEETIKLALAMKHPLQDCLYLQAARHLDASLITADRTFKERAQKFHRAVALLTAKVS